MSSMQQVLAARPPASIKGSGRPPGRSRWRSSEFRWAIAFVIPYVAVFFAFVVYPFGLALWMGGQPSLYTDLFADPIYRTTLVNTVLFVGLGVNLEMFLALLLSGFFLRRRWWIRALLPAYLLPWLIAAAQACVSFHWMLIPHFGLVDGISSALFGVDGPRWFGNRWLALGSNIAAYIWKWMPFWTVIFIAARLTIPRDTYDAAEVDGATGLRRFAHITFPLLANIYLICTLLSALWALGDFTTAYLVSSGAPAFDSDVLATLSFRYAFDLARPELGVATVLSALPVLIPMVVLLMRRIQTREVQP
jgi:multiple sugar transport system permease protein